jgi:hypothetical protein
MMMMKMMKTITKITNNGTQNPWTCSYHFRVLLFKIAVFTRIFHKSFADTDSTFLKNDVNEMKFVSISG